MKIFVAGASGAIGKPLISRLVADGHRVTGLTTSDAGASTLRAQGADAILANALEAAAMDEAIRTSEPEIVIDQLTSLPKNPADMPKRAAGDAKLRLEGGGIYFERHRRSGSTATSSNRAPSSLLQRMDLPMNSRPWQSMQVQVLQAAPLRTQSWNGVSRLQLSIP
jgi:hypothetical protein